MKKLFLNLRFLCSLIFLLLSFCPAHAQQSTANNREANVPNLIRQLEDRNPDVALRAADELIRIGSSVIPLLVEGLQQRRGCQFQFVASGIVFQLDRNNEIVNSTLISIVRGNCRGSSGSDQIIRRQAAFALVAKPEGIPLIAETLRDRDTFARRSAAFAFDELTERLEGARPDSIAPTLEFIRATKAAIPALVQALNDRDEIVRCMSYESLEQLQGSEHTELRNEANRLMQGVRVNCSR